MTNHHGLEYETKLHRSFDNLQQIRVLQLWSIGIIVTTAASCTLTLLFTRARVETSPQSSEGLTRGSLAAAQRAPRDVA